MAVMLTTTDNPFDPFTDFDNWFQYDESKGYHTCSYLSRIAKVSSDLSDQDNEEIVSRAIDEIVSLNLLGIYEKVERNDE